MLLFIKRIIDRYNLILYTRIIRILLDNSYEFEKKKTKVKSRTIVVAHLSPSKFGLVEFLFWVGSGR